MTGRTWAYVGGYLAIGVVLLIIARRRPARHPFLVDFTRAIAGTFDDPTVGCFFPISVIAAVSLWPILVVLDLFVSFITLHAESKADAAPTASGAAPDAADARPEPGHTGVCVTALRPSGTVRIDGRRYDATSIHGYIAEGTTVRVVHQDKFKLLVESAD